MSMLVERIRQVILESRQDFVQQKYGLSEEEMNALLAADPTPNKEYLEWLAIQHKKGAFVNFGEMRTTDTIKRILYFYNKLKNTNIIMPDHKQVNKFDYSGLKDVLDSYGLLLLARRMTKDAESLWDQYRQIASVTRGKGLEFLQWASEAFFRFNSYLMEDLPRLKEYISLVEDPGELKGLSTLPDLSRFLTQNGRLRSERDVNIEKLLPTIEGEYSKMYEDERYSVFIPETFKASCTLGKGTEWCTAASRSLYDKYSGEGDLYIIVDKETGKRTQAHFGNSTQIMDEDDEPTYLPYALYELLGTDLVDCVGDPELPAEILVKLSNHSSESVRVSIASNRKTPSEILEKLATDSDHDVRQAVAENPSTPLTVINKFANGPDWFFRQAVVWNASTPIEILEKLSNDENAGVRKLAAGALQRRNAA